jgi:hypothetical protein
MHDPAAEELDLALRRYCDEVISDITLPSPNGMVRHVHWRYRGRHFRASVPEMVALADLTYANWRRHGYHFAQLPVPATFETRDDGLTWENIANLSYWRWLLTTAGRRRGSDDERPGGPAGRPVRPLPTPPSLSAGAEAIPEFEPREVIHHAALRLARH